MAYEVPKTAEERKADFVKHIEIYQNEYKEFKEKGKKSAGSRGKKALTVVRKLITDLRRDIQAEIDASRKQK